MRDYEYYESWGERELIDHILELEGKVLRYRTLEHINYLADIDWANEEYKPYEITENMTREDIINHLTENYLYEIGVDLGNE